MSSTTVIIIAGAILLAVALVIAKMAIRWAVRLAMVGAILVALLGVAGFWWWTNNLADKPHPRPSASPNRRAVNR
jgi:protein-S-isoprenylcysteine O-methyltransferase Ste14